MAAAMGAVKAAFFGVVLQALVPKSIAAVCSPEYGAENLGAVCRHAVDPQHSEFADLGDEELLVAFNTSLLQVDLHVSNQSHRLPAVTTSKVLGVDSVVHLLRNKNGSDKKVRPMAEAMTKSRAGDIEQNASVAPDNPAHMDTALSTTNATAKGCWLHRAISQLQIAQGATSGQSATGIAVLVVLLFAALVALWLALPDDIEDRLKPGSRSASSRGPSQNMGAAGAALQRAGPSSQRAGLTIPGGILTPPGARSPTGVDTPPAPPSPAGSRRGDHLPAAPPPICPSLVLPNTQAKFVTSMDRLMSLHSGFLDINGTSGKTLLKAEISDLPGGRRRLALASKGCEDDPRTILVTPDVIGEPLELIGRGARHYGTVEQGAAGSGCLLRKDGQPVMSVEIVDESTLQMTVCAIDGRIIGKAQRTFNKNEEMQWSITVEPGVDAVLITTCMLALVCLRPWLVPQRESVRPTLPYM